VTVALTTPGDATLGGTTQVTLSDGVATFTNLSVDKPGSYTLVLASSLLGIACPYSEAFNITSGAPSLITVAVQPSTVTADGMAQATVTATVYDASNNLVTGADIAFATNIGSLGIITPVATNVNGQATDTITSTTGGVATVTATCDSITGTGSVAFTPMVPAQLIWHTQPGGAVSGSSLNPQPVFYLEDTHGNLETVDSSDTVTLALNSSNGATLNGTTTVTLSGGVAIFTNLSVNSPGTYTLTATCSLPDITSLSGSFTVTEASSSSTGSGGGGTHPVVYTPTVQTGTASSITANSAVLKGDITSNGISNITDYGFLWGTSASSLTNKLDAGANNQSGAFTATLSSLTTGTTYYFEAYATNSYGTTDGTVLSFTTGTPSTATTTPATATAPTTPSTSTTPATTTTPAGFSDVSASYWAHDTIGKLSGQGYISGYPDGTFRPGKPITRAEVAAIMDKVLDLAPYTTQGPTFNDVNPDDWFYQAVETANHAGIEIGYHNGTFHPNAPISRQEIACVLVQALGKSQLAGSDAQAVTKFMDDHDIAWWSRGFVFVAMQQQIIGGYPNGTYEPENKTTRAEACAMISNFLNVDK
jgi:hypothetical protein